jgi:hypothetical protein
MTISDDAIVALSTFKLNAFKNSLLGGSYMDALHLPKARSFMNIKVPFYLKHLHCVAVSIVSDDTGLTFTFGPIRLHYFQILFESSVLLSSDLIHVIFKWLLVIFFFNEFEFTPSRLNSSIHPFCSSLANIVGYIARKSWYGSENRLHRINDLIILQHTISNCLAYKLTRAPRRLQHMALYGRSITARCFMTNMWLSLSWYTGANQREKLLHYMTRNLVVLQAHSKEWASKTIIKFA